MPTPSFIDIVPRHGRGLVAWPTATLGEMHDSFQVFKNIFIGNGQWRSRTAENSVVLGLPAGSAVRNLHFFNRILDTSGTLAFDGAYQTNDHIYDLSFNEIADVVAPSEIYFESVKNRLFWAGANNAPKIWNGSGVASWGAVGPTGQLSYTSFGATSTDVKVAVGLCTVVAADATVTKTGGTSFTTGSAWVGKTIVIDGVEYTILSVTDSTHLELTIAYAGVNGSGISFQVHYGSRSWTIPPKYAYAYYNPTTGHITSVSPVLVLSEQTMSNVAVFIIGVASNSTLNGYGYTKIVIFRTGKDGSSLFPLEISHSYGDNAGMFNNTAGPYSFQDEQGDEFLGSILGLNEAPFTNDPAPNMKYIAYHDGRFWGIEEARPYILRFSGRSGEIALGVPEECWPEENFRPIPSSDNYGTGLKVVGTELLVSTTRFSYSVQADEGGYHLSRVATRGFGTTQLGMAEHPGDSSEASSSAIYVGRDKRVWRHFSGGRIEELGKPIQNQLDAMTQGERIPYTVHVAMTDHFWLLVLGIAAYSGSLNYSVYDALFYDFDQGAWYDWGYYAGDHKITAVSSYIGSITGNPYIVAALATSPPSLVVISAGSQFEKQGQFLTAFQDFGKPEIKKKLHSVDLYVSDPYQNWEAPYVVFDDLPVTDPVTLVLDTDTTRNKGYNVLTYAMQGIKDFRTVAVGLTMPAGYTGQLYKIRINLVPETTGSSGEPQ